MIAYPAKMDFTWKWAALITRAIVGLIFGMAGFWKVLRLLQWVTPTATQHIFPRTLLMIPAWILGAEDDVWR